MNNSATENNSIRGVVSLACRCLRSLLFETKFEEGSS